MADNGTNSATSVSDPARLAQLVDTLNPRHVYVFSSARESEADIRGEICGSGTLH